MPLFDASIVLTLQHNPHGWTETETIENVRAAVQQSAGAGLISVEVRHGALGRPISVRVTEAGQMRLDAAACARLEQLVEATVRRIFYKAIRLKLV